LAEGLGELDAVQVQQLLDAHHLGRLTCHCDGRSCVLPVKYRSSGGHQVDVESADRLCPILARDRAPVRFEVDDVEGPSRWSTVIAWGFFEEAAPPQPDDPAYRIRFTGMRGFYRGAQPARGH
jgi:nitroimidazol reductase NimA-like FMN-containing flavoprotein (pyridoxamine 5'-phosphate oxidase superfamily)